MTNNCKSCDEQEFSSCTCDHEPKFAKPGPKKKRTKKTEYIKIREIQRPEKLHCRRCKTETGTEAFRHTESRLIKLLCGGGIVGSKLPDTLTAYLCMECDVIMSKPLPKDATEQELKDHALEWFILIASTWLI
jgi:hypothetical protein